jgi:hypothetical protein
MTTPQTNSYLPPTTLAFFIDHYENRLQDPRIPFEVRRQFYATLCYYASLYNQSPIGKAVSFSSPLSLAA